MNIIVIVVTLIVSISIILFSAFYLYFNLRGIKNEESVDEKCVMQSKEILYNSNDGKQCADAFFVLVDCGGLTSERLRNTRRRKYKDSRESKRLCQMMTGARINKVDDMDKRIKYYG